MRIRYNNFLILVGLGLALLGAARAAPDIVQAFSGSNGSHQAAPSLIGWRGNAEPLLPPSLINYELEPVEGLSPAFTARMAGLHDDPGSTVVVLEEQVEEKQREPAPHEEQSPTPVDPAPVYIPGEIPVRLIIPSIYLDAPVVPARTGTLKIRGQEFSSWQAPDEYAAGWHDSSALLGKPGNTVFSGHHNIYGEVFRNLIDVEIGDKIFVLGPKGMHLYVVANKMLVPEKYEQIDTRMENARWILETDDERLTLITCWPYESNTHRLILVASPIE
jgi:LPXTG-site transpeptidase (sortase) family protein